MLVLAIAVTGFSSIQITAPTSTFETQSTTSVNVSGGLNATAYPELKHGDRIQVKIYNKSCHSCGYTNHSSYTLNITNSSQTEPWNKTITLVAGYNWIFLNFTNVTKAVKPNHRVTSARIINVDPDMYTLNIGGFDTINFTLDKGDISIGGDFHFDLSHYLWVNRSSNHLMYSNSSHNVTVA